MERLVRLAGGTLALGLLAACMGSGGGSGGAGGGGGSSPPVVLDPGEEDTRRFASADGTAANSIQTNTLHARSVAVTAKNRNYTTQAASLTESSLSAAINASDELTVTIDGVEHAFVAGDRADPSTYLITGAGDEVMVHSVNMTLDELIDNTSTSYFAVLTGETNRVNSGEPRQQVIGILGTETADADLAGLASATYTGRAEIETSPPDDQSDVAEIGADVSLSVDFGAGTISGAMTNVTNSNAGPDRLPGSILLNTANFDSNGYQGTMTADAAFTAATSVTLQAGSFYSGVFYGPNGEATAGVLQIVANDDSGPSNGIGYFSATPGP